MSHYFPGQRWMSETEPELGLGIVHLIEDKQLHVEFRSSGVLRIYGIRTAPLKRVRFEESDEISLRGGEKLQVDSVKEVESLLIYFTKKGEVSEIDLEDDLAFNRPEEKLFNGQIDSDKLFQLRIESLELFRRYQQSEIRGFLGGRISLIPHQFYLASKAIEHAYPRLLLADEVGLGKTIEASLIIHQLLAVGKIQRVLVLVPDSLALQWFFELHRKFQLGFNVLNQETPPEDGVNPFTQNERIVVSMGLLKGSEMAQQMLEEAEFDLVVVDEAHRYSSVSNVKADQGENFEYLLLEDLALRVPGLLLLTATPEQLGMEGHFQRLRLLDPDRFSDYEHFKDEVGSYGQAAGLARALHQENKMPESLETLAKKYLNPELIEDWRQGKMSEQSADEGVQGLIDRHGTGRMFFRNTRAVMSKEYDFFPKRVLHKIEFEGKTGERNEFQAKAAWLKEFLESNSEKTLLICHSKTQIMALEKFIREYTTGINTALFHSGLGLMARDRQAAYFSDPKGAQILLCTEIGSEGRNFEFAHQLILFDLPKKPDLLEQRIGRLDRIGQKADIQIYVPFVKYSIESLLFEIYEKGLNSFEKFSTVGTSIFIHFQERINQLIEGELRDDGQIQVLVKEMHLYAQELEQLLEEGRDYLIEKNSYRSEEAQKIINSIREMDESPVLPRLMSKIFDTFGVDIDELHRYATFVKPSDNMFIPHFPELPSEGMTFTYDRREALEREDYTFLSWDHPMVRGINDLISSESLGNMTVAVRKDGKGKKSFLEVFFLVDCPAPQALSLECHLPSKLIRVLIDKDGVDFDEKWPKEILDEKLVQADRTNLERAMKIPKKTIKNLLSMAEEKAKVKADQLIKECMCEMKIKDELEIERIKELQKVNPSVSEDEVTLLETYTSLRQTHLAGARLRLEALRLIL